ncbi:MAG: MBL fold metallo-hydrolase [Planctomycetes bacterium]|nr:MBL fold metallo-hydrolase [Planctomycetota bacterium]
MDRLRVILLGTGTSHGVPMIGCDCPVCTSSDPHDKRTRTSIVVEAAGRAILIDTPPELRIQCLACGVRRVDAILYTHQHADHITGLDDLRRFNALQRTTLNCHANAHTAHVLRRMFPYAFTNEPEYPSAKPELNLVEIDGPFEASGVRIVPVPLLHGKLPVLGFRVGRFAYCTDCSEIPPASMDLLAGLDVLVLDALRIRQHPTHFNLEQAVEAARRIGARRTYFTHIAHELAHAATNARLPDRRALGYDGQVVDVL